MTKEDLEKMAEKYDAIYERYYMRYQQAGITRDRQEAEKAEAVADVCRQALSAADDHEAALGAQSLILQLASEAERCKFNGFDPELVKAFVNHVLSVATNNWNYRPRYQ